MWLAVTVPVRPEALDAVAHHCLELGAQGVQYDDRQVTVYFPLSDSGNSSDRSRYLADLETRLDQVRSAFGADAAGQPAVTLQPDQDWAEDWKRHYQPTLIGRSVAVIPVWLRDSYQVPAGRKAVWIDPGMAFGTGEHASTHLALVLLEDALDRSLRETDAPRVLDAGTGSGVLAMVAARLGSPHVLAVDRDELSVQVARRNVGANGLDGPVRVSHADVAAETPLCPPASVDILIANILLPVLVDAAPQLAAVVRPGGWLILSGITNQQRGPLLAAYGGQGFSPMVTISRGIWTALLLRKSMEAPVR